MPFVLAPSTAELQWTGMRAISPIVFTAVLMSSGLPLLANPAPEIKPVVEVQLKSGKTARVYRTSGKDSALLGLEIRIDAKTAHYFLIAKSPKATFGNLRVKAIVDEAQEMIFVSGSSRAGKFLAAYDERKDVFITADGQARESSAKPEMESMEFTATPMPTKPDLQKTIYDGLVRE